MFMLFVDGNYKFVNEKSCFSNATQCICLLVSYIKDLNFKLNIVQNSLQTDQNFTVLDQPQLGFKIPAPCFKQTVCTSNGRLPECIRNCYLPSILSKDGQFIISGLCPVLRFLIKEVSVCNIKEFIRLLGHKKFCLKATSEICSRTNLCEVVAPSVIDNWIETVKCSEEIPDAILLLEELLNQPVTIHNRDKRQRVVFKQLTEATMPISPDSRVDLDESAAKLYRTNLNKKLAIRTNDLPPLEHAFAEGVELTLTDLALLPAVHAYFQGLEEKQIQLELLPRTLKWYSRITNMLLVREAAHLASVSFLVFQDNITRNCDSDKSYFKQREFLKLGNGNDASAVKHKKKDLEKTIRRDLPALLKKTTNALTVCIQQFQADAITLDWCEFPSEVHPSEGELTTKRAKRKCQQIENIVHAVSTICKDGDVIVDFCAGGGHVGITLAHLLPKCHVVIVDNKEESLERARRRIALLDLKNISVYQCNLQNYRGDFHIGVALHACGVATDLVLDKCLNANASFVLSPCCYGKIENTQSLTYPRSECFRSAGIDCDSLLLLGHAADQTSWNFDGEKPKQGKRCMELVDKDRASYADQMGYRTALITMQPRDCTPKNNLIVGASPLRREHVDLRLNTESW